eukprot:12096423-Alexandrium_andersonii.AAC.1
MSFRALFHCVAPCLLRPSREHAFVVLVVFFAPLLFGSRLVGATPSFRGERFDDRLCGDARR